MKISYDAGDDILIIEFSNDKIVRDVSLNWNVNVGMAEHGVGEIVILNAKKAGYFPLEIGKGIDLAAQAA